LAQGSGYLLCCVDPPMHKPSLSKHVTSVFRGFRSGVATVAQTTHRDTDPVITVLPLLHGRLEGPGGASEAAAAIRIGNPRQVMVELCAARYAEVLKSVVCGPPLDPPLRVDILSSVHGGLMGREFGPVLHAAREVGAAVIPVDRTRAATRSRVAQRLWHPRAFKGLLEYGARSVLQQGNVTVESAEVLRSDLRSSCPPAYDVLIDERCSYMAHQARAAVEPGTTAVLVCGALHHASLSAALSSSRLQTIDLSELAQRGVPIWPIYALWYGLLPTALAYMVVKSFWDRVIPPEPELNG